MRREQTPTDRPRPSVPVLAGPPAKMSATAAAAPTVQAVLDHHESLSNHGGDGTMDVKAIAFTLGFLAGIQHVRERSAPALEALRRPVQTDVIFFDMDDCLFVRRPSLKRACTQALLAFFVCPAGAVGLRCHRLIALLSQ